MNTQKYTPLQALQKLKHYCAYQERSHSEAREKLFGYGLNKKEVEDALAKLIEENYLNEERFAIAYAGGKFRMKGWGRVKIKYELKKKQVSDYCIRKALVQIDDDAYEETLQNAFDEKLRSLKGEKNVFIKKRKLQDHLIRRGFETDFIRQFLNKL